MICSERSSRCQAAAKVAGQHPSRAMVLTFALSFAIMVQGEILTGAAAPGLSPAEVQKRMYKVVLVELSLIWVWYCFSPLSHRPTSKAFATRASASSPSLHSVHSLCVPFWRRPHT